MNTLDLATLKSWFLSQSRDLPWRNSPSPYTVWVSEIMLQQTQVSVVIPYFERWMKQFPSIEALAKASSQDVIKAWEGLGYYSRARNLHEGAKYILEHFNGILPNNAHELSKIKGIGPYTVGAILSFAFHEKMPAVDGNVLRVLARYYALNDDIAKAKTVKKIQALTLDLLPEKEPWIISEALIELGATVCTKQPKCQECPLIRHCNAFQKGLTLELPIKTKNVKTTKLNRLVAVIIHQDKVLIRKGEQGKIMADLYEFPYVEMTQKSGLSLQSKQLLETEVNISLDWKEKLPEIKHSFTRYEALLEPHLFTIKKNTNECIEPYEWVALKDLKKLPFSSGHRQILSLIDFLSAVIV